MIKASDLKTHGLWLTWICLAASLLPLSATAQSVRAVEHPNFTKLILPVSAGSPVEIERSGRVVTIVLTEQDQLGFEPGQIFSQIPHTRVLSARTSDFKQAALELSLGCDCSIDAERLSETTLSLTIRRSDDDDLRGPSLDMPTASTLAQTTPMDADKGQVEPEIPLNKDVSLAQKPSDAGPEDTPLSVASDAPEPDALSAVRSQLSARLSEALDSGVLVGSGQINRQTLPEFSDPLDLDALEQVRIRSADRSRPLPPESDEQDACGAEQEFALPFPSDESTPYAQIATHRRAVFDPTERVDDTSVLALTETYLAYGFGVEAAAVLDVFKPNGARSDALGIMAGLLSERLSTAPNALMNLEACAGPAAIWSALYRAELDPNALPDLTGSFEALPPILRQELGSRLSLRLLDEGAFDRAADVFAILDRSPGFVPERTEVAKQALTSAKDKDDLTSLQALADLSRRETETSPQGLLLLAQRLDPSASSDAWELAQEVLADLEIARRLLAPASPADKLTLAQADLMSRSGNVEGALALLSSTHYLREEDAQSTMVSILLAIDPSEIGDAAFARLALTYLPELAKASQGKGLRHRLIDHMLEIGLPNAALELTPGSDQLLDRKFERQASLARSRRSFEGTQSRDTGNLQAPTSGQASSTLAANGTPRGDTNSSQSPLVTTGVDGEEEGLALASSSAFQSSTGDEPLEPLVLSTLRTTLDATEQLRQHFTERLEDTQKP